MKRTFIPSPDFQDAFVTALVQKAFTELQNYTGWPTDYIQTLLDNYQESDNFDCLSGYVSNILNHQQDPHKEFLFEFYINTDDMLMLDAYPITGDPETDNAPDLFIYDPKDPNLNDYRITVYEDPLTHAKFNFFID